MTKLKKTACHCSLGSLTLFYLYSSERGSLNKSIFKPTALSLSTPHTIIVATSDDNAYRTNASIPFNSMTRLKTELAKFT